MSVRLGRSLMAVALAATVVTCSEPGIHAPETPGDRQGVAVTDAAPADLASAVDGDDAAAHGPPGEPGGNGSDPSHGPSGDATDGASGTGPDFADLPLDPLGRFAGPQRPEPDVAVETIGPEGGTVRLGDFEIEVPAGAVTKNTLFMIRRPVDRRSRARVVAELRPHRVSFERPVIVRMPLRGTSLAGEPGATVVRFDGDRWSDVATRIVEDGARLETRTRHLSFWGASLYLRGELSSGG